MAHFAAAAVVSGMASAAGATGVVAAAGFDRRGRARGPGGGEAGGPPGVKPPVKLRCARARPSTLMSSRVHIFVVNFCHTSKSCAYAV